MHRADNTLAVRSDAATLRPPGVGHRDRPGVARTDPVDPSDPLDQGVERCCLRDGVVEVQISPDLERLGRHENGRCRLRADLGVRARVEGRERLHGLRRDRPGHAPREEERVDAPAAQRRCQRSSAGGGVAEHHEALTGPLRQSLQDDVGVERLSQSGDLRAVAPGEAGGEIGVRSALRVPVETQHRRVVSAQGRRHHHAAEPWQRSSVQDLLVVRLGEHVERAQCLRGEVRLVQDDHRVDADERRVERSPTRRKPVAAPQQPGHHHVDGADGDRGHRDRPHVRRPFDEAAAKDGDGERRTSWAAFAPRVQRPKGPRHHRERAALRLAEQRREPLGGRQRVVHDHPAVHHHVEPQRDGAAFVPDVARLGCERPAPCVQHARLPEPCRYVDRLQRQVVAQTVRRLGLPEVRLVTRRCAEELRERRELAGHSSAPVLGWTGRNHRAEPDAVSARTGPVVEVSSWTVR